MVAKLQLILTENDKVIDEISMETSTRPACMIQSLRSFQELVNATLTKVVENSGGSGGTIDMEDDEASDKDEADGIIISPKKRKKAPQHNSTRKKVA